MDTENIGFLIDAILAFEEDLDNYYKLLREESSDNGLRIIVYFLARKRARLKSLLDKVDPGVVEEVRKVELADAVTFDLDKILSEGAMSPVDTDSQMLLAKTSNIAQAYAELCDSVIRNTDSGNVISLFKDMSRLKTDENTMLMKMQALS